MRRYIFLLAALLLLIVPLAAEAQVPGDVPAAHWAIEAVRDMFERGILVGYPDNTFRGDRAVTRYELAVALARLLDSLPDEVDLSRYVTRTELQTALQAYPTRTELQTTLQAYPTRTELQTTLQAYVTRTELNERLAGLPSREDIATLQRLVAELRTDLTALGVRVSQVETRLSTLETRVGELETRVTRLEELVGEPGGPGAGGLVFHAKGGIVARDVEVTEGGFLLQVNAAQLVPGIVDEYDRPLIEGFSSGAAFDIDLGFGTGGGTSVGARIFAVNEDLTETSLDDFDTELGLFLASGMTRLDIGVFDAYFSPFTMARSVESILEQIPAFERDWYLNGAKLQTRLLGAFDTTVLYSEPRDEVITGIFGEDTYAQTLFGARVAFNPVGSLNIGANYALSRDQFDVFIPTTLYPALSNRVWSVDANLIAGQIGLYGEYADSRTENLEDPIDVTEGTAYKAGVVLGPVNAYYLSIGGLDNAFFSRYGDPAWATMFNGHDPSMGYFLDPFSRGFYFGQNPNLAYTDATRFDLNNNVRGYGAALNFGKVITTAEMNHPISPVLDRGENDAAFRLLLGYERLEMIDPAAVVFSNGVLETNTMLEADFQTAMASLALDITPNLVLLGSYRQRQVNGTGEQVLDDGVNPPVLNPFAVDISQDAVSLGLAFRFSPDVLLALQYLMLDTEDLDPAFDSDVNITKATLSLRF